MLTEVFQITQTVDSFHLAEENKQEFPHDDVRYNNTIIIHDCIYSTRNRLLKLLRKWLTSY